MLAAQSEVKPLRQHSVGSDDGDNTFDFFNSYSQYESDQDEDYSEKEDLIQNKKSYAKDLFKPFEKNIPKAEVEYLLRDQVDYNSTDYLLG